MFRVISGLPISAGEIITVAKTENTMTGKIGYFISGLPVNMGDYDTEKRPGILNARYYNPSYARVESVKKMVQPIFDDPDIEYHLTIVPLTEAEATEFISGKSLLSAREMGQRGGSSTSDAKAAAVRENGKKGGRPKKQAG